MVPGQKRLFLLLQAYILIIAVCSWQFPFFWDTVLFSRMAQWYSHTGFQSLIVPQHLDTGNQPFFPYLLARCWQLFGKYLWTGHLLMLPFLSGIAWQYWLLVKRLLPETAWFTAALLFILEPTLMAQSTQVIIDIPLLFFYLLGINTLLSGKRTLFIMATLGLAMTNLRGTAGIGALWLSELLIDRLSKKSISGKHLFKYIPALLLAASWFWHHRTMTGWAFMQQGEYAEHRQVLGFTGMLKNGLFVAWRFFDFGKCILYFLLFLTLCRKWLRRQVFSTEEKTLWTLTLIPLLLFSLLFMPFSNPIGHRYFLLVFVLFSLLTAYYIHTLKTNAARYTIIGLCCAALICGPFIYYNFPYSNGWDSTILYTRSFGMDRQMRSWTASQHIAPDSIATGFPLHYASADIYLESDTSHYSNKWYGGIRQYPYVLQSNISNAFTVQEMQDIRQHWVLIHEIRKWPFYMRLYQQRFP